WRVSGGFAPRPPADSLVRPFAASLRSPDSLTSFARGASPGFAPRPPRTRPRSSLGRLAPCAWLAFSRQPVAGRASSPSRPGATLCRHNTSVARGSSGGGHDETAGTCVDGGGRGGSARRRSVGAGHAAEIHPKL